MGVARMVDRLKRLAGIKSDDEVADDVRGEPHVKRALRLLERNARLIDELEMLEKRDDRKEREH